MRVPRFLVYLAACFAIALAATGARADGLLDVALGADGIDVLGAVLMGDDEEGRAMLGGRFLYSDEDDVDASVPAVFAGFSGHPSASDKFEFIIGAQGMFGEAADQDVRALALGGKLTWLPDSLGGLYFEGEIFFAPSVLTFGDTEEVMNWVVRGGFEVTPKLHIFVDYSKFEVEVENFGNIDVEKTARLGATLKF